MTLSSKKIAIIGSGVSGMLVGYLLSRRHQVTLFEASTIGGHTATKEVSWQGETQAVDTGFIVFNDRTYPNFIKLMSRLGVKSQPTEMGFSVTSLAQGFEYSGTSVNGLFAQRKNLFSISHWRMLSEIVRFNKACTRALESGSVNARETLGDYLEREGYSQRFRDYYILPMVSAIWSSGLTTAAAMPLLFFIRFFHNHGLLTVTQQPQWYTITGGSNTYIEPLTEHYADRVYAHCPVTRIVRTVDGVQVTTERFGEEHYDEVVIACHSDQALALLADASDAEQAVLGAIPYQQNDVTLHTDTGLLPRSRRAWASWNYLMMVDETSGIQDLPMLTYNMNILQNLKSDHTYCVTVNPGNHVNPERILGQYRYSHPVFTRESIAAQQRWSEISGVRHTHYCGAYWCNGFHEDGVVSALRVADMFGEEL
ncbi:NAD(P)/FAD-dependent oxidoreductase [Marinimicrobium alkaliphilum]|uniref:NAD(P)/FAD-dependent oxidoreductase n=1 Tax=Marinimicrobium alkaliphilum TaxID=2202654 RepID=UPI000DB961A7|nr:FAD-dependent oxidoreductase [Marinimicrobium alkaliphilum]